MQRSNLKQHQISGWHLFVQSQKWKHKNNVWNMFKLTMKVPEWCYELVNTLWVSARKHKKLSSSKYMSSEPLIELHFGLETWQSHYICYRTLMIIPQCAALWTLLAPLADETNGKDWMATKTTLSINKDAKFWKSNVGEMWNLLCWVGQPARR